MATVPVNAQTIVKTVFTQYGLIGVIAMGLLYNTVIVQNAQVERIEIILQTHIEQADKNQADHRAELRRFYELARQMCVMMADGPQQRAGCMTAGRAAGNLPAFPLDYGEQAEEFGG